MRRTVAFLCTVCCLAFPPATWASGNLTLAWDPNPEPDIASYRVLYGPAPRAYTGVVDIGLRTRYTLEGLIPGQEYFLSVQAYNTRGQASAPALEVSGIARSAASLLDAATILLGLGTHHGAGGWFATRHGEEGDYAHGWWSQLPWPAYNATGGGVRLAAGDLDGDGASEIVVGLGRGSQGWVAILDDAAHAHTLLAWIQVPWPAYNAANGEVFPAIGDLDGDGRAEIVLGLGEGGQGWYLVLDDATTGFAPLGWRQVPWKAYNAANGATYPAVGDLDGDGRAEIVLGLGEGSAGWLQVVNSAPTGFSHRAWVQVPWNAYNAANGATRPAVGDLDGDGRAEIVAGLGRGGGGWILLLDDAAAGFEPIRWLQVSWPAYNTANGETWPAVGNIDGDARMEIVAGLGAYPGAGGWFEIFDDAGVAHARRGWYNVGYQEFTANGGGLFPAIASRR
jgi:hypothetical protein